MLLALLQKKKENSASFITPKEKFFSIVCVYVCVCVFKAMKIYYLKLVPWSIHNFGSHLLKLHDNVLTVEDILQRHDFNNYVRINIILPQKLTLLMISHLNFGPFFNTVTPLIEPLWIHKTFWVHLMFLQNKFS